MSERIVENVKPHILIECREQVGLSIAEAEKKAKLKILEKMERGEAAPTYSQLGRLADRYCVPSWVFVRNELPRSYRLSEHMRDFRKHKETGSNFDDYRVRGVMIKICQLREFTLELREKMDGSVPRFVPPKLIDDTLTPRAASSAARAVREWLEVPTGALDFLDWKDRIEDENVFVFMTGRREGWSNIKSNLFRGLSIYYDTLPIVVINDSDARRAQSFTLFHELGHLLRRQSSLDIYEDHGNEIERWCDEFAAEVLMPGAVVKQAVRDSLHEKVMNERPVDDIMEQIVEMAKQFKVSPYAFTVKMRHLNLVTEHQYNALHNRIQERQPKKPKASPKGANNTLKNQAPAKYSSAEAKMRSGVIRETVRDYRGVHSAGFVKQHVLSYLDGEIDLCDLYKRLGPTIASTEVQTERRAAARKVLRQYGKIYSHTVVQTYLNGEIELHKLCRLLGIKNASEVVLLQEELSQ